MKNILSIALALLLLIGCGETKQGKSKKTDTMITIDTVDSNTVYVYYFHGKQRCTTCNSVEKVAKETVETNYSKNQHVEFKILPTTEKANESLVEKYEITWNGLIVAKGDNSINITEKAFANAVDNPEVLSQLIKEEINNRLN